MNSINNDEKPLQNTLRLVPDTSVIVEGLLSKKIQSLELRIAEVIIHEAVFAELESQANKGKDTGFLGLEEIKQLRLLSNEFSFTISFKGKRPTDFEIKNAKSGEIDSLIRQLALDEKATLFTADKVQALVAESKGLSVVLHEFDALTSEFILDKYFDEEIVSISMRENSSVVCKKGSPGNWKFYKHSEKIISRDEIKEYIKKIIEEVGNSNASIIEYDKKGSMLIHFGKYNLFIIRPPLSNTYEIICSLGNSKKNIPEFSGFEAISSRLSDSKGVIIAGELGSGKSSLSLKVANYFSEHKLNAVFLDSSINLDTKYNFPRITIGQSSFSDLYDYFVYSTVDWIIFDELRSGEEFKFFAELRLSGNRLLGIFNAGDLQSAIQKLSNKLDLRNIYSSIDTIIFVKDAVITDVLKLSLSIKTPSGLEKFESIKQILTISNLSDEKIRFELFEIDGKIFVNSII